MKQAFNFVWVLGSGSTWQNYEIRFSIRSVLKHHPNANILIIGERPTWFRGLRHVYVPDSHECPYVNQWRKLEKACELFDEFIYMDDDFYLMKPFEKVHYRLGALENYITNLKPLRSEAHWVNVAQATYDVMPEADRHLLHVPLPIISTNFLNIAESYPQRHESPSLVPRQIYCHHETDFEVRDISRDVKVTMQKDVKELPFFSSNENVYMISRDLVKLYPEPSIYEADQ